MVHRRAGLERYAWSVSHQLSVVVPQLPYGTGLDEAVERQRAMLDQLVAEQQIQNYALWLYTPMALPFGDHLKPRLTVFDCMDELSAFMGVPPLLLAQEQRLMSRADMVFTGGHSLYEAKQKRHQEVYVFPSCIDYDHFAKPRIGYSGVIDERMDHLLVAELARRQPDWQFVFLGSVVKINPQDVPQGLNLHYLGMKTYNELPVYLGNWEVAILPFALNEATR